MQHINLVEARLLPPLRLLSGLRLATLIAAGALLVFGHWGFERVALSRALAMDSTAEQADTNHRSVAAKDGLADLRERVAQREALRDLLAADHLPQQPAALLRSVIDALPQTLWLTEVEVARERALRIAGGALDAAALNSFAAALAQVPSLRGMPVHTVRLEPAGKDGDAPAGWRFVLASGSVATQAER